MNAFTTRRLTTSHAVRRWMLPLLALTMSSVLLIGARPVRAQDDGAPKDDAPKKQNKKGDKAPPPPYTGVRHRIAAVNIDDSHYYGYSVGNIAPPPGFGSTLLNMMTTILVDSGHFHVFERAQLDAIKNEIVLDNSGMVSKETAVKIGKLKGVEYIITGAVTEYRVKKGGGGIGFGGIKVGSKGGTVTLAVDLRIVDTTTGEVLYVVHAKGNSGSSGTAVSINTNGVSANGGGFQDASLDKAARDAMANGVKGIMDQMDQAAGGQSAGAWEGKVLDVDLVGSKPSVLTLTGGKSAGFAVGDELEILVPGKEYKDPDTGDVIGRKAPTHIARCRVTSVDDKIMSAKIFEIGDLQADDIKTYIVHRTTPPADASAGNRSVKP